MLTIHETNALDYLRQAAPQFRLLNEVGGVEVGLRGRMAVHLLHGGDPSTEAHIAALCGHDLLDEPMSVAGVDPAMIDEANKVRHKRSGEPVILGNGLTETGKFEISREAPDMPWLAIATLPSRRMNVVLPSGLMQTEKVYIHPLEVPTLGLAAQLLIAKARLSDEKIDDALVATQRGEPITRKQIAFLSLHTLMEAIRSREKPNPVDQEQINFYRGQEAIPLRNMRTQLLRSR